MIPYPTLSTPVTGESKLTYMYVRLHQEYKCLKPDWACENAEGCSIHRVRQCTTYCRPYRTGPVSTFNPAIHRVGSPGTGASSYGLSR